MVWEEINVKEAGKTWHLVSLFVFFLGEACSGGAQKQGAERRSDSVRSPSKFYVQRPIPPPPSPPSKTPSYLLPNYPPCPTSPPFAILPHTIMKLPQPAMPPRDRGRFKWGIGGEKNLQNWFKEKNSPTHSSQKRMFLLRFKWEKNRIDKWQWVLVFVNTSFFVIYSTIQAAKVLIAVCHFYMFLLPAHIWM